MNNTLELFVNGTDDTIGQIEMFGDEPISLNMSVSDIRDISKRNSTYSQTFTVPATKENNILFNHIFNIGSDSTFDPSKKTPCFILNETVQVFTGNLQLTKINVSNRNVISYDCVVYGEMIDLVKTLGDKLIRGNPNSAFDLDFSELDHNRSAVNIEDSWIAETKSLGYYYPLIDFGYDLSLNELNSGLLSIEMYNATATSAGTTTLYDAGAIWAINVYATMQVNIIYGQGAGQTRNITSNTGNTLTVSIAWSVVPDNTSVYSITRLDTTNPYNSTGLGLNPNIFKPAISNSYLFTKILTNAGFSIEPGFLDTDVFTETIIPFNGVDNLDKPDVNSFKGLLTYNYILQNYGGLSWLNLDFNNDYELGGFDITNSYNNVNHKYTAPINSVMQFMVDLSYGYSVANFAATTFTDDSWYIRFFRSSLATGVGSVPNCYCQINYRVTKIQTAVPTVGDLISHKFFTVYGPILDNGATPAPVVPGIGGLVYTNNAWRYPAIQGETFWVEISIGNQPTCYHILDDKCAYYNKVFTNGVVNNYIQMNDFIPKNIKQADYVKSVVNLFNLQVIPNKDNPKRLAFVPRDDYYASGVTKNWTNKVDHTTKVEETLISEQQNKTVKLTYKADKDYYNTNYTDATNTVFGEFVKNIDNEWIDGEKKIEVIFSPTPIDKVFGSTDVFLPKISKLDLKTGLYSRTDFNIRFLRKNPVPMSTVNTIQLLGRPTRNTYPYCGHLDHPINANIDYNFGAIKFAYYPELVSLTPDNLVEKYWINYLNDISDKNSKILKLKIYLTPNDIAQFNYSDNIFIDGLTDDGGHYFNVNKITYIPTSNLPSVVELIKVNRIPKMRLPRIIFSGGSATLNPVSSIEVGTGNNILSPHSFVVGNNNFVGLNSTGSLILGSHNLIADNVQNVVLLNANSRIIASSENAVIGNTYFSRQSSFSIYDVLDGQQDSILNPFQLNNYSIVEAGLDAVRNLGGNSTVMLFDGGIDTI